MVASRRRSPSAPLGGCTFAEHPGLAVPDAGIIWHADFDPGTIAVTAWPTDPRNPDCVRIDRLAPWLAIAVDAQAREHALLSDGWHHIRFDVEQGRLAGEQAVLLHYRLQNVASAEARLLPLRRFLHLYRHHRFGRSLYPPDPRIDRWIEMLRAHDALLAGASQREIAAALYGADRIARDWGEASDSLRSRIRRLVRDAHAMARGGYLTLIRRRTTAVKSFDVGSSVQ